MKHITFWLVLILIAAGLQFLGRMAPSAKQAKKIAPASLSKIDGTDRMRLTLLPEAAKRLDIQTALVREEPGVREKRIGLTRKFAGEVIAIVAGRNTAIVQVFFTENDANSVRRDAPAFVLPLARESKALGIKALPAKEPSPYALSGPYGATHYEVSSANHGLVPRQLVVLELPLAGSGEKRRIIPYAAVLYDATGNTWVYTNPEPLVFVRQPIDIETILGDQVLFVDGPPAGTSVVTAGAAELFGTEFGVGK